MLYRYKGIDLWLGWCDEPPCQGLLAKYRKASIRSNDVRRIVRNTLKSAGKRSIAPHGYEPPLLLPAYLPGGILEM